MKYRASKIVPFDEAYKTDVFNLWWKNRKPKATALRKMIPIEWGEDIPSIQTIRLWINDSEKGFKIRAASLDRQMREASEAHMIREKIEMLQRHGEVGRKMQLKALDALETMNFSTFSENALVRFIVEGVRIERESVGLPQALEKLLSEDDENLLNRLEKIIGDSQSEILVLEDGEAD